MLIVGRFAIIGFQKYLRTSGHHNDGQKVGNLWGVKIINKHVKSSEYGVVGKYRLSYREKKDSGNITHENTFV